MQTINLIIPMAGFGKRFTSRFFNNYKTLLEIEKNITILDKIISNFNHKNLKVIFIINKDIYQNYKEYFRNKKNLIVIDKHDKGPVYTLFKAKYKLKKIIRKKENIFISYSDINWKWNFKNLIKYLSNQQITVFTHRGYHPHLDLDCKSDFCKVTGNNIKFISKKKPISEDYKNDHLAIGCYYFKTFKYLEEFFEKNSLSKNKEYYLLSVINYFIKQKIKVSNYNIKKFVHLGLPDQYLDYLKWYNEFKNISNKKNNFVFRKSTTIMLMAGKGSRVKTISKKKFLIPIKNKKIYEYIFDNFNTEKKIIITNKENLSFINKKYKKFIIKNNNSMIETVLASKKILINERNFFLTSCDCYGEFDFTDLIFQINKSKADIIFFRFNFSNLQKKLFNSHTQIITKNDIVKKIEVKSKFNPNYFGHAGFFWIKDGNVFNFLNDFLNDKKKIKRELIIDDYFKYVLEKKKIKGSSLLLKRYIHIGSMKENQEFNYWQNYFL
tara:strand:- start:187 stop:1671 length:1485 start_codon:yes stop_codon:yes gene_type:complete